MYRSPRRSYNLIIGSIVRKVVKRTVKPMYKTGMRWKRGGVAVLVAAWS